MPSTPPAEIIHRHVDTNGVRLHLAEIPGDGPTVLLLHGFPESWRCWKPVMERLAARGHRVVAPDMRGYGDSQKPRGARAYRWDHLTGDILGLVDALGQEQVHLVGHDWGAIVAWMTAMRDPSRFARLAICNVPHPAHFERMALDPAQLRRSWYIFFFQLPGVPEHMIRRRNWRFLRRALSIDRIPGTHTPEELDAQIKAAAQPGALTSMLNYYRAMIRQGPLAVRRRLRTIDIPTLVLWGERDIALGVDYAAPPREWVPNQTVRTFPEASHWIPMDLPDTVAEALADHFAAP